MGLATDYVVDQLSPIVAGDQMFQDLVAAIFAGLDDLAVVSHNDGFDGPGILLDIDNAPVWALNWLGQLAGATDYKFLAAADKRVAIKDQKGTKRGRLAAIEAAVKTTLTGTKFVFLRERYEGDPYKVLLVTHTAETPDAAATAAACKRALPAGRILTHSVVAGWTYAEIEAAYASYAAAEAAHPTYSDAEEGP